MTNLPLKNAIRVLMETDKISASVRRQMNKYINSKTRKETLEQTISILKNIRSIHNGTPINLKQFNQYRKDKIDLELIENYRQIADEAVEDNRRVVVRMPKKEAAKAFRSNRPVNVLGSAFNGKGVVYEIPLTNKERGEGKFEKTAERVNNRIVKIINDKINELKSNVIVWVVFLLEFEGTVQHISVKNENIGRASDYGDIFMDKVKQLIKENKDKIEMNVDGSPSAEGVEFLERSLVGVHVHVAAWMPLRGRSYMPLPDWISLKKACVNPKNEDDECFKWAVLASLHPSERDKERITKYRPFVDKYDWSMLQFPVDPRSKEITHFEKANDISVNIYAIDEDGKNKYIYPKEISKHDSKNRVHLLLIEKSGEVEVETVQQIFQSKGSKLNRKPLCEPLSHYVSIQDLSRLLASQVSSKKAAKHFCHCCLHGFGSEELLEKHAELCRPGEIGQRVEMPEEGSTINFRNYHKMLRAPYVVYFDTESYLSVGSRVGSDKVEQLNEHIPASFHYVIKCSEGWTLPDGVSAISPIYYSPVEFLRNLNKDCKALSEQIDSVAQDKKNYKPMELTIKDEKDYQKASQCYLCNTVFTPKDYKVRDHCHVTGAYRGAAHCSCNLNMNYKDKKIPVFAHNAKGYDWHLLIKSLPELEDFGNLDLIPKNFEQYLSFWGDYTRFLDSMGFYGPGTSLAVLVEALKKGKGLEGFPTLKAAFSAHSDEKLKLRLQKGIFPYSWFSSPERMNENQLPPPDAFKSDLTDESITTKDYDHALKVWDAFECKTFKDYHDIYLKCDVAQLADVFESYREVALKGYELDPCWYFSAPNMAWDAMLKKTGVELEQLTDPLMYEFFEKGKRGGISMISNRYSKANNTYIPEHFNPSELIKYIIYLDANNLYGWAMLNKQPYKNFKWVENCEKLTHESIKKMNALGDDGMTLEVDLEYPTHLHDLHNDYPMAPEKMKVSPSMVSPFNRKLAAVFKVAEGCEKLIPNLQNKEKYVVHLATLQFYIRHGLRVTCVHRAVSYKQKAWMTEFINYNTAQRTKAVHDHEKDFYKLMNNSVFGKTMEDVRGRACIKVRTKESLFLKDIADPAFKSFKIFTEKLVACEKLKTSIKLDKPVYVGQAILDLSKMHMYSFWYDYMKPKYGDRVKLLATDTDSILCEVTTPDLYKDMELDRNLFDRSEYKKEGLLWWMFDDTNKKVVGKFKDETKNVPISSFVGLKPKMYALKLASGDEKKTCKGIKTSVVKKEINFDNYYDCVMGLAPCQEKSQVMIRSENHTISTLKLKKRALFAYDTKRWILEDGIRSLAHGHFAISTLKQ